MPNSKPLAFLAMLTNVFTKPAAALFLRLAEGWLLCPSRHALTNVYRFADPEHSRRVDATHYFFRDAAWNQDELFKLWALHLVRTLAPDAQRLVLALDDTTHHKTGPKIDGARTCRDAVRSTRNKVVHCWALQYVPLCLVVEPPWGSEPLALPLNVRLNRKAADGEEPVTLLDHAEAMLRQLADWLPEREFDLVVDGAYATLAGRGLPRTRVISRLRSDAAVFEPPPARRPGQRGRPPMKGKRLPKPKEMANRVRAWRRVETTERGRKRERLVYTRVVVWARVSKRPVLLVISRDPSGKEADDFFFTTDVSLPGSVVVELFSLRWSVEDTFRNVKQYLRAEEPQSWKRAGPERAGAFGYLMYGAVWLSRWQRPGEGAAKMERAWYTEKVCVSFWDALADVRVRLWGERIKAMSSSESDLQKIRDELISALAWAS